MNLLFPHKARITDTNIKFELFIVVKNTEKTCNNKIIQTNDFF